MTEHLPDESPASIAFIERLLSAVPSLRDRYEHLLGKLRAEGVADHGASFLVSEYTRDLVEGFGGAPQRAELAELAAIMEREYGADTDVDNIIEGAFLLHAGDRQAAGDPAEMLGPKLRPLVDAEREWRAAPADAALVRRMLSAVPALSPLTEENTWGDQQDVLVHGFLSDVVRQEVENIEAGRFNEPRTVVDLLESLFEAGELVPGAGDADEAIAVSFVENMPYPGEPGQALIGLLGPKLRAELGRQRGPRDA